MPDMEHDEDDWTRAKAVGKILAAARPRSLSMRAAAKRAGFSEGQWRAMESGVRKDRSGESPTVTRPTTLALACLAVGADMEAAFTAAGLEMPDQATINRLANPSLEDSFGPAGASLEARLDQIEARLAALENPPKVTALNPRQRSRKADPDYRVDTARAASRENAQPDRAKPAPRQATRPAPSDDGPVIGTD